MDDDNGALRAAGPGIRVPVDVNVQGNLCEEI
jgi:hypothetical protein